jgi:hypothetical protein
VYFSIEVNSMNLIFAEFSQAGLGIINKDSTVWLDGARLTKTYIPLSFLINVLFEAAWHTHPQKYIACL